MSYTFLCIKDRCLTRSHRGLLLAGRLKALDVDYVVIDRNERVGDNWALRYDCMRFHVYKSFCETPYICK